jgi:hypothetical protein
MSLAVITAFTCGASAQLREDQVLVIFDSRKPDSIAIAEHYAGSAKVPGGSGSEPGVHPSVHVFDLASASAGGLFGGNISYDDFVTRVRNPIRDHLDAEGLAQKIRCLVVLKDMPHRIQDTDNANVGDNPTAFMQESIRGDVTCASMSSELALLWQDLSAGEAGQKADSFADGAVLNPYWQANQPIWSYSSKHIRSAKAFVSAIAAPGQYWRTEDTSPAEQQLTPGDFYLVCRLDGYTVAEVNAMVDRAQGLVVDVDTATLVLDESESNGVADSGSNGELDNQGNSWVRANDDYETVRDIFLADGRYDPANVRYDGESSQDHFFVGPLLPFDDEGIVIDEPVILLSHYGSNHYGSKPGGINDPSARTLYAESFIYAPGAIFNSMESWNGRGFAGMGHQNQEQIVDFIKAGGTFATGNVWEPFAWGVPDSEFLARRFLLGDLTWAEAAWSAMPVLSWQSVVVGDPLARVVRTSDDITGDGRIDNDDLHAWEKNPTDLNRDGSADGADRALLMNSVRAFEQADMQDRRR